MNAPVKTHDKAAFGERSSELTMNPIPILQSLMPDQVVLLLSAHCDDAEIGCGGLLRRLLDETGPRCFVKHVVFTGGDDPVRKAEQLTASHALGISDVTIQAYPETALPDHWQQLKHDLLEIREQVGSQRIGMVICPRLEDRHQDHRVIAENVWRIFRNHLILEYEALKYEGDLAPMNLFVRLSETEAHEKVDLLLRCYPSRACHQWWSRETLLALMRVRGVEAAVPWAEAFLARKLLVS